MNRILIGLLAAVCIAGCETTGTNTGTVPDVGTGTVITPEVKLSSNAVAICVGLTSVNPYAYGGWAGDCPGCDVDAKGLYNLFVKKGFTSKIILNSEATWTQVRGTIVAASKDLKAGDLLVVAISGHGGQLPDDNGDESDGQDETLCLWDGQVRDDEMLKLINSLPGGIRLVLINDQCHSEGNFRAVARVAQRVISFGYWGNRPAKPIIEVKPTWSGQLIQFAGCRESSYSYGSNTGGTWTQSLLGVYKDTLTWRSWFDFGKARMPGNQVPQWVEYGAVQDTFRNGAVLK